METCHYYIKKTNNPRICTKKICRSNNVLDLSPSAFLPLCNQHCKIIQRQIITQIEGDCIGSGPNFTFYPIERFINKWDEYKITLMLSMLQNRKDEFDRIKSLKPWNSRERKVTFAIDGEVKFIEKIDSKLQESIKTGTPVNIIPKPQKECPICLDQILIKKMTFLTCAHALCTKCLRKIQNRNVAQRCPVCRHHL